ncbi:hypothetical protein BDV37DRAFT_266283 [Aspergillus pseudonomiae]|uniref:Uncharacterized protein n=1 Tax=Aspergillus pseudonomiae TaxID=1506151 RepID=A0A5N7CUA7_9EURO|nr:uncharacterized protein BDV37DRAFT_266283 [Aspergillus pseudonomiae]KAE8397193.1 hypothetical protein BDV37DRAFT_266283 [Aspergillus pseudonomiae]
MQSVSAKTGLVALAGSCQFFQGCGRKPLDRGWSRIALFLTNFAVKERKVTMGAGEGLLGLSDGRVIWLHRWFTAVAEKIDVPCYDNTHNRERVREVKVPYR